MSYKLSLYKSNYTEMYAVFTLITIGVTKDDLVEMTIKTEHPDDLKHHKNLKKVIIEHDLFNASLDFLPEWIEEIEIKSIMFNKKIKDNFPQLKKLVIKSTSFDSEISNDLIERLELLEIDSPTYTRMDPVDNNQKIKIKSLMFGMPPLTQYNMQVVDNYDDSLEEVC